MGLLRAFKVYKPAIENAAFPEIENFGIGLLGRVRMPLAGGRPPG